MSTIVFPDRASAHSGPGQQAFTRTAAAAAKASVLGRTHALRWRVAGDRADLFVRVERPDPIMVVDGGSALHYALVALAGQGAVVTCERLAGSSAGKPIATVHVTGFVGPLPERCAPTRPSRCLCPPPGLDIRSSPAKQSGARVGPPRSGALG